MAPGIPPEAIAAIRTRAEGIPLYAVETVRMLLDAGRVVESGGRYRLEGGLGDLGVPDSLLALLGSRLDALATDVRELVGFASVLGVSFRADTLAAVAGRNPAWVRDALDDLVARELFAYDDEPRSPERGQHRFLQGVLREVAYGRLSKRERQARHVAAAEAYAAAGAELAGVVATHYLEAMRAAPEDEQAALRARARASLVAAAERSRAIGAYASAARYLGDAIELAADDDERLRLREARLRELADAVDAPTLLVESAELLGDAERRGDRGLTARTAFRRVGALLQQSQPAEAVRLVEDVRERLGSFMTQDGDGIRLLAELGRCHLMAGSPRLAAPIIEEALTLAEHAGLRDVIADLIASKGWAIGSLGRSVEAGALLRGGIVFAERDGHLRAEFRSRMNFSAWAGYEDLREAFEVARVGYERARQLGYTGWSVSLAGNALFFALELGEWSWIEQVTGLLDPEPTDAWQSQALLPMALVRGYRGEADAAAAALDVFERFTIAANDDPQVRITYGNTAAELAFARGDAQAAVRSLPDTDLAIKVFGHEDIPLNAILSLNARDLRRARRAAEQPSDGRLGAVYSEAAAAAAAAIEGEPGSLGRVDAAAERLDVLGLPFTAAKLRFARALFDPTDNGARAAAAAAAAVFRELRAVAMLRQLDALLGLDHVVDAPEGATSV
jgi:hypothetical protein